MGRARVGGDLVGVELGESPRAILEPNGVGPVHEVARGAGHDVSTVAEAPVVLAVLPARRVPEGHVLRVEGPLGNDRFLTHQRPVYPVRGPEGYQPPIAVSKGLVPLVSAAARVGVHAGREVVASEAGEDYVVVRRALELHQPECGLGPADPVRTLGIAVEFGVGHAQLSACPVELLAAVVHAVQVAVSEDGDVTAVVALPWLIEDDGHLPLDGSVHHQLGAGCLVDESIVHQQLKSRADVDRLCANFHPEAHPCCEAESQCVRTHVEAIPCAWSHACKAVLPRGGQVVLPVGGRAPFNLLPPGGQRESAEVHEEAALGYGCGLDGGRDSIRGARGDRPEVEGGVVLPSGCRRVDR